MFRHPWALRLVFLAFTCGTLGIFESYNQTIRVYHVVSSTIDLGIPLHISLYSSSRSQLRRIQHSLRSDKELSDIRIQLQNTAPDVPDHSVAGILDRSAQMLKTNDTSRFSLQYRAFAVVHDSAPDHPDFDLLLDEGNSACGRVSISEGSVRCVPESSGGVLRTGTHARDLIETR